jgi:hypothetical protein
MRGSGPERTGLRSVLTAWVLACGLHGACSLDVARLRSRGESVLAVDADVSAARNDAGASLPEHDAGVFIAFDATDAGDPYGGLSCGVPGLRCCTPGNTCQLGGCLRGQCTAYAGVQAQLTGCGSAQCVARNAYTAGCGCPQGFESTMLLAQAASCADQSKAMLALSACSASRSSGTAWAGAFVRAQPAGTCAGACLSPNAYTQACSCPQGTAGWQVSLGAVTGGCAAGDTTLALCMLPSAAHASFAGAYALSATALGGCILANPQSGGCSCPAGTSETSLPLAGKKLVICNR